MAIDAPCPPVPEWAIAGEFSIRRDGRSMLAHVNRQYNWHVGQLRGLMGRASSIRGHAHRHAVARIIDAEIRDVTSQFLAWKALYRVWKDAQP